MHPSFNREFPLTHSVSLANISRVFCLNYDLKTGHPYAKGGENVGCSHVETQ